MSNNAQWQRAHRERRAAERERMRTALKAIVTATGDKTGEAAVTIRKIATNALEGAAKESGS